MILTRLLWNSPKVNRKSSFFDFGITDIGVTNRVTSLLNYLGMNVGGVSAQDYIAAVDAAKDMPCWPAADSVFMLDDCIVVKLSD